MHTLQKHEARAYSLRKPKYHVRRLLCCCAVAMWPLFFRCHQSPSSSQEHLQPLRGCHGMKFFPTRKAEKSALSPAHHSARFLSGRGSRACDMAAAHGKCAQLGSWRWGKKSMQPPPPQNPHHPCFPPHQFGKMYQAPAFHFLPQGDLKLLLAWLERE